MEVKCPEVAQHLLFIRIPDQCGHERQCMLASAAPDNIAVGGCVPVSADLTFPFAEITILVSVCGNPQGFKIPAIRSIVLQCKRTPQFWIRLFRKTHPKQNLPTNLR